MQDNIAMFRRAFQLKHKIVISESEQPVGKYILPRALFSSIDIK